jgi:release factor H-coupled RctB family protein
MNSDKISLFASSASRIEGESLRQLERVAALPGMLRVAGFPDLHPGKGSPVGAAMLSKGEFYPYLVGSDVGCGMGLFATDLPVAKAKPEKWSKKLRYLEEPWDGDSAAWLAERGAQGDGHNRSVGTIGAGNHFAELLRTKEIHDREAFLALGLDEAAISLLVHSGSRGLGEALLRSHTDRFRDASLAAESEEAETYLERHRNAIAWATANRELIAHRLLDQLGSGYRKVVDLVHNSVTPLATTDGPCYLHRKGAAPSDAGAVVIPGSRGAVSYLVMPNGEQERNLRSVAHGAGRKWNRSECAGRLRERYSADSLRRTGLGSYVICEDKGLLYEEAPQAYKDIEAIIEDMVSFGLIRVVASFTPLLTYKVRER